MSNTAPITSSLSAHRDIVATAHNTGDFGLLLAAAAAAVAGLVDRLKNLGRFMVFAPNDDAFRKLSKEALAGLHQPEGRAPLVAMLTLHVVPSKIMLKNLSGNVTQVKSLQGSMLTIDCTNGMTVNGGKMVETDIDASDGVIHVIDTLLTPPDVRSTSSEDVAAESRWSRTPQRSSCHSTPR